MCLSRGNAVRHRPLLVFIRYRGALLLTEEHIFEGAIKWRPPLRKRRWAEPGGV